LISLSQYVKELITYVTGRCVGLEPNDLP